ncbi:MAG TPA: metalloregulator ArsR/SmtB family transcription factor, partial [Thermoanaerobaculia bacterium]|nr:metalloregulator ArsR/SmtB family transcription factor [Thermoanaerobaculia bacterium]
MILRDLKAVAAPQILDQLGTLSDAIRARTLAVLASHELTVTELCSVLQLPQSTVSRHLKTLIDRGWLAKRADGTRHYYALDLSTLGATERRLWMLLRESLEGSPQTEQDSERLRSVLGDRAARSAEFFSTAAEQWDGVRGELYGGRFDLLGLLGLLDRQWSVGDFGCGTGQLAAALAPFVERVVAVDSSAAMLRAAKARLHGATNVDLRRGRLEDLPVEDGEVDLACLFLVLHHVAEPAKVVREAERALSPGGVLLVVDMRSHQREDLRQQMGHVWLGFEREPMERMVSGAGLEAVTWRALPADPQAKGPSLFVVSGRKPALRSRLQEPTPVAAEPAAV